MNYKKIFSIFLIILINGCVNYPIQNKSEKNLIYKKNFINKGFTLIYDDVLYKKKIISRKLDNRSLTIFQKNLSKGTNVRVKNLINNKSIVATVGIKSEYPQFNNSILSKRIANLIKLNPTNPYIEIYEILDNSSSIIKRTKTFEEEKKVADKAPVETISINDLNKKKKTKTKKRKKINQVKFNYIIKIGDFYYKDSAKSLIKRIKIDTLINDIRLQVITTT